MTASTRPAAEPSLGRIMLLVLLPFGSGYFLSYLFRAVNAVVAPDLVRDIELSASSLGLLTAAYLFAFAAFQLPLGILLDRFGPRRVQTGLPDPSANATGNPAARTCYPAPLRWLPILASPQTAQP